MADGVQSIRARNRIVAVNLWMVHRLGLAAMAMDGRRYCDQLVMPLRYRSWSPVREHIFRHGNGIEGSRCARFGN